MEDKKRKKEDKRKREASQKVAEQKNKVPDSTNPTPSQSSAALGSAAAPSPGPAPSASPSPAAAAGAPSQGGNNAKRPAVVNGQPPTAGAQATQRYVPREVPPRFRCQQDHKVLLKRGQPLLSCMLLGGGGAGGGAPALSPGDSSNSVVSAASDSSPVSLGSTTSLPNSSSSSSSSSSSVAASSTISSSNYANSTWGVSSSSLPLSQGWEKVIVDGSNLEEWPSIVGASATGAEGGGTPWGDRKGGVSSPPSSSSCLANECTLAGVAAWGGSAQVGSAGGDLGALPPRSRAPALAGTPDGTLAASSGTPSANFSPNANPVAWPALVQDGVSGGGGCPEAEGRPSPLPNLPCLPADCAGGHLCPPANPVSHQHHVHQIQAGEAEPHSTDWAPARPEQVAGPKIVTLVAGDETDCRGVDVGDLAPSLSSSSSSSSSCRALPFSSNPKTGASRTDSWEGGSGGTTACREGGSLLAYSGQDSKGGAGILGGKDWGMESGDCRTPGVSQGAWAGGDKPEASVGEWGSSTGDTGVCRPSNSVEECGSGGGGGVNLSNPPPGVPTNVTQTWDNQKGCGDSVGCEMGEWAGQGRAGGGSSSSGGEHSRSRGGPHHAHQRPQQPHNAEVALQNLLSRPDLDPRVLSNTGWGQTHIRQNVAWDLDGGDGPHEPGLSAVALAAGGSTAANPPNSLNLPGLTPNVQAAKAAVLAPGDAWESSSSTTLPACGPQPSGPGVRNPAAVAQPGPGGSVGGPGNLPGGQGKCPGSWGAMGQSEGLGQGWSAEEQEWKERRAGAGGWGDYGQQGMAAGGGGSGWGGAPEEKGVGGWKEKSREAGGWSQRGGGNDWEKRQPPKSGGAGWADGKVSAAGASSDADMGTWGGGWDEGGPRRGWEGGGTGGDGAGKAHQGWGVKGHPSQMPNSQAATLKAPAPQQQSQSQREDAGGGWARPSGPPSHNQNQNQSSGWTSGPMPQAAGSPAEGPKTSGWEEPSPQSISRKMEIDDGTSAWGDPSLYNYKTVNLWDKSGAAPGQGQSQPHGATALPQQHGPQLPARPRHQPTAPGSRDSNPGPGKNSSMGWGSGTPSSPCVDNGTAAWGNPTDSPATWGDLEDSAKPTGWGSTNPNAGSKTMQDSWGEAEGSVSASRHSSWEEDEESGGVWSSAGSQGSSSSYNSGGWGQSHGGKKGSSKGTLKGGTGDAWMNPMTRQFSNMGLLGEDGGSRGLDLAPGAPPDKKLDGEKRAMGTNEYNGEMRKGGRAAAGGGGGGGGTVFRSSSSKDVGPTEPGPFYDKTGGHNVFGSSGGMAQSRGVHQPVVPPINPSPGIRAQVPHQFLSPQVPGSVLKQMPPPSSSVGGVGAGVFPAQLSPQHIAMLSSIYPPHIQFQLACQLLLQHQQQQQPTQQHLLQNQRKFPQNMRQQADPQQLARIMAVLQQQRQQQPQVGGTAGGSKLSPSHLGGGIPKQVMADPLPHPALGGSLAEQLHPKSQGGHPGFGSGANSSGLDMGSMVGGPSAMKDSGGQQSCFKWLMEGHSPNQSSQDSELHKNGPISAPVKLRCGSPYSQYELLGGEGLGVPPQGSSDNWHRTPGKMGTKAGTSSWPPEFQPGVPWKGIQSADPESDPYMTPGSVLGSSGSSSLNDTEHQLLRDTTGTHLHQLLRDTTDSNSSTLLPSHGAWPYSASDSPLNNAHNSAKYSEYKPSWPPEPIGHNKLWKANRNSSQLSRPPPGLTHQKQPSVSPWAGGGPRLARGWGGSGSNQETRYGPGSAWSDAGASRNSCWLLLSNLTPQIDGSTLRTICMQHGPLLTFHLGLTQGSALIRYSSQQEAAKAQSALHMCVLGNTTILAEFVSEEDVGRYFAHSQAGGSTAGSSGGGAGVTVPGAGGGQGPSGTGTGTAGPGGPGSGGSTPGSERERERAAGGGPVGPAGGSGSGGVGVGNMGPPCSGWQGLDGAGSSPDPSSAQGPGLSIFAQWSSSGAGGAGAVGAASVGSMVEPGRQGLWGGMTPGYPSSSLWGAPPMEDRLQMSSPAALLPGDLLGGGADSM